MNFSTKSSEKRSFLGPVARELRAVGDQPGTIEGYGSVFGVKDGYGDIVKPGAFTESLGEWRAKGRLPKMLWQHEADEPIGRWTDMVEDEFGLRCRGQLLLSLPKAQQAHEMLKAGLIDGLSIGFQTVERSWNDQEQVRFLEKVKLWEVSVVTFPANEASTVSGVKNAKRFNSIREFEAHLRDECGFSNARAKAIATHGFKHVDPQAREESGIDLAQVLAALRSANAT